MPVVLYARSCDSTAHSVSYEENVDIVRFSTSFFKFTKYINNFYHFDLFFHLCIWHRMRKIRNRLEIISCTIYIQSVQLLIIHKILCYSNWLFDMNITEKKLALDLAFCFQQLNISKQVMEFVLFMNP